ncbi:MAG: protein kinase [Oscillatoria sp. SIO1A7]|nr:protein kinase [Oscillatoria sp. SIO1A7]
MQNSNPLIGKTIGDRYRIIESLVRGGFGQTYLALDTQRPREPKCVVKQLKPEATDQYALKTAKRLFDREAEALEELGGHDRIPRLLAHFEENQEFYLVQEFIEGQDLSKELLPGKQFGEDEVVKLLRGILEVLEFVQQHNVIHRDLKPPNIMRRQDGKIVLIDFGAVKEISTQVINAGGQAKPTVAIGTHGYMAPEQSQGDPRLCSDIYSVGAIAIQALSGIYPKNLPKDARTGQIVWRDRVKVSPVLGNILDKMVCFDFSERYQSAAEVLRHLKNITRPTSSQYTENQPDTQIQNPQSSTKPGRTVALALLAIALLCLAGAIAIPQTRSTLYDLLTSLLSEKNLELSTYENYDFRIKYPRTWRLQETDDPFTGEAIKLIAPKANSGSAFSAQLIVTVEPDVSETLAEYADSSEQQIRSNLPQANIIQRVDTTLAKRPAYELTYEGIDDKDGTTVRRMEVATLWQYKAYVLTYEAEASDYPNWEATAREIIDSFELLVGKD